MTNDKPVTCRAWMRGDDEHISDQSLVSKADYISIPQSVMDQDIFQARLTKANFKFEEIKPSKSGLAWNAYRVGYREDYLQEEVGLTI